ncbi:uncharacterized protein DFL_005639 [Arthrobotrys flagrans]|uniref:Uncharacterized protein n=1 Tax=Arthrobotrys flagrans TaxID=97331 RepID=A0A436ZYN9_ARTFL|nr:hypothetical protein DFL_005639 [Arthrobotrys flagrans]
MGPQLRSYHHSPLPISPPSSTSKLQDLAFRSHLNSPSRSKQTKLNQKPLILLHIDNRKPRSESFFIPPLFSSLSPFTVTPFIRRHLATSVRFFVTTFPFSSLRFYTLAVFQQIQLTPQILFAVVVAS